MLNIFFNRLMVLYDLKSDEHIVLVYRYLIVNTTGVKVIRGLVFRVVDIKSLAPHRCGFESREGPWIISSEEVIQSVVIRCQTLQNIGHFHHNITSNCFKL